MKDKINWFSIFLGLMVVFYATASGIYIPSIRVKADVPSSQKVVGHSASWGSYDFSYSFHQKYFTIQDSTGIPTSTLLNAKYFYTSDNETFCAISSTDLITLVLNRGLGLILDPDNLGTYVSAFLNAIGPNHLDTTNSKYVQGGLYDSQDNFLGYCLNDISGCYWNGINPNSYNIPSQTVSNVYNFNEFYNTNTDDYFTYYPISADTIIRHYKTAATITDTCATNLRALDNTKLYSYCNCDSSGQIVINGSYNGYNGSLCAAYYMEVDYLVSTSSQSDWNNFCNQFEVKNNELLMSETYFNNDCYGTRTLIDVYPYDSSGVAVTSDTFVNFKDGTTSAHSNPFGFTIGTYATSGIAGLFGKNITIYKNNTIKDGLANNNYYPSQYTTNNYGDFDSNNDNSIQATATQITQSVTYNSSIYTDARQATSNYYDNGYYDSSSATTNITNITNNYYSDNQGGEGGEGGNGSGDNGGSGDSGDSPTWNALMEGLLHFLQAIGDVIGTLIAGLLAIFADIISALSGISESLGSIGTFISQIFSFLPSSVVSILVAAISFCTLCAIIKFIRG